MALAMTASFSAQQIADAKEISASTVGTRTQREACPYWKAVGVLSDHIELACGGERSLQLNPLNTESPSLACCPEPYGRCSKEERIPGCDEHIVPILTEKSATASKASWVSALQRARGALVAADQRCSVLAPEQPHATCDGEKIQGRDDIYCEMMLFQTEQLGDGNPDEYKQIGCSFPGEEAQNRGQEKGSAMTRRLKKADLPHIWLTSMHEL